ncbi:phosphoribosylanthranilate isomerase [Aquimarina sp. ERC-38]|uniref:phosphoribosylanthranilate isomerase n=1 Tax=Aquimarina sp. ERC-38 TaxID=2949996 RepID=UPI0022455C5B|nr:phosphoribosylanthranilate isomerase [Aquimarina sp. ERC-38]UZO79275.1 phosphoribosylanthranilate isomerase [Aquimarina sp. ERC-38]
MKDSENIKAVASLQPDYMGFIFYKKSARNFDGNILDVPAYIKKVGVFVDATIEFIVEKVKKHQFAAVQLHGNESPEYCKQLKEKLNGNLKRPQRFSKPLGSPPNHPKTIYSNLVKETSTKPVESTSTEPVEVWKVFSIKDEFNFDRLQAYEGIVDYFLFDTKGKEKGGNGYTFDWTVLNKYPSSTPFILSGGIGLDEIDQIRLLLKTNLPIYAIDVNSKLEDEPGLKNIDKVKHFLTNIHIRRDLV